MNKEPRPVSLKEVAIVFFIANTAAVLAKILGRFDTTGLLMWTVVMLVWLILPVIWINRCRRSELEYGISGFSKKKGFLIGIGSSIALLVPFAFLYLLAQRTVFPGLYVLKLSSLQPYSAWQIIWAVVQIAAFNIIVVGGCEETFFRGYLQTALNRLWGRPWKLFGVSIGSSLFVTAVLFGLLHIIWWGHPLGALVIIPALGFGFLREWSKGILAPVLFHGFCNTVMFVLNGEILNYLK